MTIEVTRNENGPIFDESSYEKNIMASTPLGTNIISTLASDRDVSLQKNVYPTITMFYMFFNLWRIFLYLIYF